MVEWIISNTVGYFFSKGLDFLCEKAKNRKNDAEIQRILSEYNKRFQMKLEFATREAEIDFYGLQEFTEHEINKGFFACLLGDDYVIRKERKRRLVENAYAASNADNYLKKKTVYEFIELIFDLIGQFAGDHIDPMILMSENIRDDELRESIEELKVRQERDYNTLKELIHRSSFAYMIDNIVEKKAVDDLLHYSNQRIGLIGRNDELSALQDFLDDERDVLFMGLTGPGGFGKSKLVHEFMKRHRCDSQWEMRLISKIHINKLCSFNEYIYPCNLLLVIDYAGLYAESIGTWLYGIKQLTKLNHPNKIRLVLLERNGVVNLKDAKQVFNWLDEVIGHGDQKRCNETLWYKHEAFQNGMGLKPFTDDAAKELINEYALAKGKQLDTDAVAVCYQYSKKVSTECGINPLYVVMTTEAFLSGKDVSQWDIKAIIEYCIERNQAQWKHLVRTDEESAAIEHCMTYSTAVGGFSLNEVPKYVQSEINCLKSSGIEKFIALICTLNQSSQYEEKLNPVEPNLIGELYFLQRLQLLSNIPSEHNRLVADIWEHPPQAFDIYSRCISDYASNNQIADFLIEKWNDLIPESDEDVCIGARSRLQHLMLVCVRGKRRENSMIELIKTDYSKHPANKTVICDYAAALMLDFKATPRNSRIKKSTASQMRKSQYLPSSSALWAH